MQDFKIRRGLSTTIFPEPGVLNKKLVIEEGCWYLCTDTAELFLGTKFIENGKETLTLKRINGNSTPAGDQPGTIVTGITKAEIDTDGNLVVVYANGESSVLGRVVGDDGLTTAVKIGETTYTQADGVIELPEFATLAYVDTKISGIKIPDVPTKVSELENDAGYITYIPYEYVTKEYNNAINRPIRYEVLPHDGLLVDYRDSEIRINTERVVPTEQQAGPTAPAGQYYIPFKAYAPEGAVAFKEWQGDKKDDTIHHFDEDFSGTDKFGRNYSLIWMSIANFDGTKWNLYGNKSKVEVDRYLGFYYTFEWYDKEEKLIDAHTVRIILTNDKCHYDLVPEAVEKRIAEEIEAIEVPDLTGYATETFVKNAILEATFGDIDVDLSDYATKTDIAVLASKEYVDEKFASIESPKLPTNLILFGGDASPEDD